MIEKDEEKLRLFTGLSLTPSVQEYVVNIVEGLSRCVQGVRWIPSQNLHVTLKFLGWCLPGQVPMIIDVIKKASAYLPLKLEIGGVGGFPSQGSAKVIWVGVDDPQGNVQKLSATIESGAEKCGFEREKRPYHPHITVGRAKNKTVRLPGQVLRSMAGTMILEVDDIVLYRSVLERTGAEYSVLERLGPGSKPQ